jgi:hypothetical protein
MSQYGENGLSRKKQNGFIANKAVFENGLRRFEKRLKALLEFLGLVPKTA